jgi:hypothetical protein
MSPASTSSDGVTDDGGVSAAGAPFAPVVGVLGAAPAGATVVGGCSGAGFAFASLAAFGLAALAALAAFGLAAVASLAVAVAAFGVAAFAFAAEDFVVDVFAAEARAVDGFAVEDLAVEDLAAEDLAVEDFAVEDLVAPDALAVPDFAVAGLAAEDFVVDVFAVEALAVDGFAVEDFAPAGRTVRADVAARATLLAAVVALDRAALVVDGIAEDIALAASVSDLTAVSIALVAVLIACSAVVMVLAEDVAFVAAVFSCAAADVTLVAAVETVRGDGLVAVVRLADLVRLSGFAPLADAVRRAVAGRAALLVPVLALADRRAFVLLLAAGLAVARVVVCFAALAVDDLAELVRPALAVRGRVGFFAAGVVGTDLPPSGSVTGSLIPRSTKFYTSFPLAHEPQQTLSPQLVASVHIIVTTSGPRPGSSRRRRARVWQQPADSRDRLLRRRAAPDRNADEIAAQRHRHPHHSVRDVTGQIKQFPLHRVGQHVANGNVERPGNLLEPRFHFRHRRPPIAQKKNHRRSSQSAPAGHAEDRTAVVAFPARASAVVPSSPLAFPTMYALYVRSRIATRGRGEGAFIREL